MSVSLAALWTEDESINTVMANMIKDFGSEYMTPNRWPVAPANHTVLALHLIGQGHYHREFRWSWVGCLWALVCMNSVVLKNTPLRMALINTHTLFVED